MSGNLTTLAHESALGAWLTVYRLPAPALRPYAIRYTGYRERERHFGVHLQAASSQVPLILNLGPPFWIDGPLVSGARRGSFVAGLHDAPTLVGAEGPQHCLQIDLTPLGAWRLLGLPMHQIVNQTIELSDILGERAAGLLLERLAGTPSWEARFAAIDALLLTRLASAPDVPPALVAAWERLHSGNVAIGELARELGWSNKHLIAQFREHFGLPPKALARILRFERAASLLRQAGNACLATIAQEAGYYDQAHLHRDVRQFAGLTPGAFLGRRIDDMDGLIGDEPGR